MPDMAVQPAVKYAGYGINVPDERCRISMQPAVKYVPFLPQNPTLMTKLSTSKLHSYNVSNEHLFVKMNKYGYSNILSDPPHKISSKMNNFWMY